MRATNSYFYFFVVTSHDLIKCIFKCYLIIGKNEDAVKLYDLTSLCSDSLEEKDQNPFTVPVGMLLYRVARNMRASQDNSISQVATISMLLKNCIKLLSKEKHPEVSHTLCIILV